MCSAQAHVCFTPNSDRESEIPQIGPKADIRTNSLCWLIDDFIGAGEHSRWECETHFLGGLKINHQLILGRRLHGHLGWLLALEDAIDIFRPRAGTDPTD